MSGIPSGFHTITPYLVVADAARAIELYARALGAREEMRVCAPGSDKIIHACLQLGSSKLFLCDENPQQGMGSPRPESGAMSFYLYLEDVDARHRQAVAAGMQEAEAPADMFWGDRVSMLRDPFGYTWTLASQLREVSEQEIAEAVAQMSAQPPP